MSTTLTPRPSSFARAGVQERALVIGATGAIGSALVQELLASGAAVRVMCRRPEQVRAFTERGVDAVQASFENGEALREALQDCPQLFLNTPVGPEQYEQNRLAIDAAVEVGVRHVVKVSASDANPHSAIPWARDHALADQYLERSGLAWTVLKASAFISNLLTEAAAIRRGWLPQTSGNGATAWVDTSDVAAVAARVLTDADVQGQTGENGRAYLLTGDRPLSYPEIAGILTATLGHRVRYVHLPAPAFYAGLRASGVPAWQARGLVHQFVDVVRRGQDGGRLCSSDIPDLLGRPAITVADFALKNRSELGRA
ncbi:NAD(P)-dependent oxidoreductase [Kineosporia sp. NBRC 101677]|uniref:NAD(P)H-binding protein n=1 Tax=Kineosporia sp. NBRC 101677 TaxID=3032197 RepID=UPI0024A2A80E|nr:NAD(P)H-binding protein [Kineosporia sp. NBRC 101677]GLY16677.1 NAD(P)-dependent oxidoreductase [Kineosporia sp. NBRC 101677]